MHRNKPARLNEEWMLYLYISFCFCGQRHLGSRIWSLISIKKSPPGLTAFSCKGPTAAQTVGLKNCLVTITGQREALHYLLPTDTVIETRQDTSVRTEMPALNKHVKSDSLTWISSSSSTLMMKPFSCWNLTRASRSLSVIMVVLWSTSGQ